MSDPRQILAVDERRTTLDFLRSVLSLVEEDDFEVSGVPSGEEGLLELRRKRYDLLLSGVRLPGIDGVELARRARQLWPNMPIILASSRPLPELQDEAAALSISHVLSKPLDAEEFLAAVREALSHAPPDAGPHAPEGSRARPSGTVLPEAVEARLKTLCAETGAVQALLATVGGDLLVAVGSQSHPELGRLVATTARSVRYSLRLSDQLDDEEPRMVQFLQGARYDLYWASVDRDHFIVILFDAQVRRGRIGTVWVFAQRAANELRALLAEISNDAEPDGPDRTFSPVTDVQDSPPSSAELDPGEPPEVAEPTVDSAPEVAHDPELEAFWDEALADENAADFFTAGISLDEAREKGLIAEDFDPQDQ